MADIVIIMGPTGAGKTAQGVRLAKEFNWAHLSSGELLRNDNRLGPQLRTGVLVPSLEVERVVEDAVRSVDPSQTILLDGFPRLLDETEWLQSRLSDWRRTIAKVVIIEISMQVSQVRLQLRGRADDTPEALAKKWQAYNEETLPVLNHYEEHGTLSRVSGDGTEEEVYSRIKKVLNI